MDEENVIDVGEVQAPPVDSEASGSGPAAAAAAAATQATEQGTSLEEDQSNPWKRPSDMDTDVNQDDQQSERAAKKPRREIMRDTASKARGQRMFGMLKGTLSKFKDEGSKSERTEAAKRRQEVEDRLRSKLRAEQEESQRQKDRLQKERNLKSEFSALQDEKNLLEQVHKRRHANLTHMAQFLVAGSASTDAGAEGEGLTKRPPPMADRLPMHASPTSSSLPPLYFKPYKLTDAQSATIEAQISDARAALESDQEAHVKQMEELDDKIDEKARAKDRFEEERERAERLERLEKRRAEEGDEDDDMGRDAPTRSRSPPPQRSERDTTSRDREDVRME